MADEQQALEEFTRKMQEAGGATDEMIRSMKDAEKGFGNFAKQHLGNIGSSVKSFSNSMLNGSKGFDSLLPIIDSVGGALAGLAASTPLVGHGLGKLAQVAVDSSKFLVTELGKQAGVFQSVSRSGVLGAGGMRQFADQAFASRLSLEQFGKVVVDNGRTLAAMRGSAMSGTKAFSDMTASLSSDQYGFTRQLGYGAEEIADITAGFMKQQTMLGMTQRQSTESLTQSTAGYMKELDMLSRVTGDNRKALQERQAAMLAETRFNAKIQELLAQGKVKEARELQNFVAAVDAFAPAIATGARDIATAGTGTIAEGQQLLVRSGGSIQQILKQIEDGTLSSTNALNQLTGAVGQTNQQYLSSSKVLGDANMVTANGAEYARLGNRAMQEEFALRKQQADQLKGTDPLQAQMASSIKNLEDFTMNLNQMILDFMPLTAQFVDAMTGSLAKMAEMTKKGLDAITGDPTEGAKLVAGLEENSRGVLGKNFGEGTTEQLMSEGTLDFGDYAKKYIQMATSQALESNEDYKVLKGRERAKFRNNFSLSDSEKQSLLEQAKLDYQAGKGVHDKRYNSYVRQQGREEYIKHADYSKVSIANIDEFASGGIANYPSAGKLAKLHGPEAIIPLPDGKTVPVSIAGPNRSTTGSASSSITGALMSMLGLETTTPTATTTSTSSTASSTEAKDLMLQQNSKLDELIRLTSRHLSVSEKTRAHLS